MQKIALFLIIIASVLAGIQSRTTSKPSIARYSPFNDLLNLFPLAKLREIEEEHLKTDDGFRAAILYLQGPEWTQLVDKALSTPQYRKFSEMVEKYDFNLTHALKCLRDHIKSMDVVSTKVTSKPNLGPFIEDVLRVIPFDEIVPKIADSPKLEADKQFRKEISKPQNRKIAIDLHTTPEMVKLRDALEGMNFYVEPYIAMIYTFLGWVDFSL